MLCEDYLNSTIPIADIKYLSPGIDAHGCVFERNSAIYRALTPKGDRVFQYIKKSGASEALIDAGLVRTDITDLQLENYSSVIRHEKVPFVSYCQEWPPEMLRQAALLQCRITRELLRFGLATKDAHPWNITFDFTRPVFIDFGSIAFVENVRVSSWIREFRRAFYIPLWLAAHKQKALFSWCIKEDQGGVIRHILSRTVLKKLCLTFDRLVANAATKGLDNVLESLIRHLESLELSVGKESSSDDDQIEWPSELIAGILNRVNAESLIDLAVNNRVYSKIEADLALPVVAMGHDHHSIDRLYRRARADQKNILTLAIDLLLPTPAFGIGLFYQSSYERLGCDVGLALSVIQDLAIGRRIALEIIASIVSRYVRRYALVEFITPDDPQFLKLTRNHKTGYLGYTEDRFTNSFMKHFQSFNVWAHPNNTRKLYLFER